MQENMRTKFDYSKLTRSYDQNMKQWLRDLYNWVNT